MTRIMTTFCALALAVCCLHTATLHAQDTFSIVAVDPDTREVGSAGASCVTGAASIGGVIVLSGIIPGRGGVNAQAYICINPHVNLDNAMRKMLEGLAPDEIIAWLRANDACFSGNFNPEFRQYGIADLDIAGQPRTAAFTGNQADNWKGHITGPNYSIQGNILIGPHILDSMEARFLRTEGSLADKLMAAMQGANVLGADSRCLSAGTSSTSAFLRVFKPTDSTLQPWLQLNVAETRRGVEPIDSLQKLYDQWRLTNVKGLSEEEFDLSVFPNPTGTHLTIACARDFGRLPLTVTLTDLGGSTVGNFLMDSAQQKFDLPAGLRGIYFLQLHERDSRRLVATRRIVVP